MPPAPAKPDQMPTARARCSGGKLQVITARVAGMIMAAVDMIERHDAQLDEATIRHELEGNICRCTGYHNIVKAVQAGSAGTRSAGR